MGHAQAPRTGHPVLGMPDNSPHGGNNLVRADQDRHPEVVNEVQDVSMRATLAAIHVERSRCSAVRARCPTDRWGTDEGPIPAFGAPRRAASAVQRWISSSSRLPRGEPLPSDGH